MGDKVSFLAALAGANTAAKFLTVSSEGDAKVVLETDAVQLPQVLRLCSLGGKLLRVTVEEAES